MILYKRIKKYFYLLIFISIFLSYIYLNLYKNISSLNVISNIILEDDKKCKPLTNDNEQFSVVIDSVKYPKRVPLYENRSINFECLNSSSKIKTILMWNKIEGPPNIKHKFGIRRPFEVLNCPVTNCELTNDHSKFNISELVLFHPRNNIYSIPKYANKYQRFVHVIFEPPAYCHLCTKYENTFNLTVSYKKQDDFMSLFWTDSGLQWGLNENFDANRDIWSQKTEFATMSLSNCQYPAFKHRLYFLDELKKYINFTINGRCGKKHEACKNFNLPNSKNRISCREFLSRKNMFFFSFENSYCNDYISEKFFNTLKYDIIPVVLGGGDYEYYIPKSAFINAKDFKSPKDLANYLIYLSKNKTAYNEYFKWKKYMRVTKINENQSIPESITKIPYDKDKGLLGGYLCEMCIKLHLEDLTGDFQPKRVESLHKLHDLKENCYGNQPGQLEYIKGFNLSYTYFMSPD